MHASDLHLDGPVRGVAGAPAALREVLRDASLLAWHALVDLAVTRGAAGVVVVGGLFDPEGITQRACAALRDGLERLRERSVDVLIALAPSEAAVAASLPWLAERASLVAPDRPAVRVVRDGRCLATVHGASGGSDDVARLASARRPGFGLQIGLLPGAFEGQAGGEAVPAERFQADLDYWALGGARTHAVLRRQPWAVCAGSTQGRSCAAGEIGPKGCVVVDMVGGRIAGVAHAAIDAVRFLVLEVEVDACADLSAVAQRLLEAAEQEGAGAPSRPQVIEAVLCGSMPRAVTVDRFAGEAELLAALRRDSAWRAPQRWWARVRDRTVRVPRPTPALAPLRRILVDRAEAMNAPLPRSTLLGRTFAPLFRQWGAEGDLEGQRELLREGLAGALQALDAEGSP